jgi:hypothetical protein
MNFLCEYVLDQDYDPWFALEAKPNEPRGGIYFPTTGANRGFIAILDHPEMVGAMDAFKGAYTPAKASALKTHAFDRVAMGQRGMQYGKLDQLFNELLLGVR